MQVNKQRWFELMNRLGIDNNQNTYDSIISKYSEKHRHYHNIHHINAVLGHLDKTMHLAEDADSIELALWFHDAIYKIFSATNEKDSADWALKFLDENRVSKTVSQRIHTLIMSTIHDAIPHKNDEKLMVDIDLSILGSDAENYQQFELWIREEYKLIPRFIYKKKRKEILKGFLDRERIYSHEYFYNAYEVQARNNISTAILSL